MDDVAARSHLAIVLGGFNLEDDWQWAKPDVSDRPNADFTTVTEGQQTNGQNNEFTDFIDYVVFAQPGIRIVDRSSFAHLTFRQEDERVWNTISDHCPVLVAMWSPQTE